PGPGVERLPRLLAALGVEGDGVAAGDHRAAEAGAEVVLPEPGRALLVPRRDQAGFRRGAVAARAEELRPVLRPARKKEKGKRKKEQDQGCSSRGGSVRHGVLLHHFFLFLFSFFLFPSYWMGRRQGKPIVSLLVFGGRWCR